LLYLQGIKNQWSSARLQIYAYGSVILSLVLVVSIFVVTAWMTRHNTQSNSQEGTKWEVLRCEVIKQIQKHRFLSIGGLLVAFLHVTVFLALAIAFFNLANNY